MKKLVYVHGSFMNDNFGDYLLYNKILSVCDNYKNDLITVSSGVCDFYLKLHTCNIMPKLRAICKADCVVLAGGGYFGESNKMKLYWNLRFWWIHAVPLAGVALRRVPVYISGVGVGPLSLKCSQKITAFIFNHATCIVVRDKESKDYLKLYGVKKEINILPDWILGVSEQELIPEKIYVQENEKYMVIHLTSRKTNSFEMPIQFILEDLTIFAKENPTYTFHIICDQGSETQLKRAKETQNALKNLKTMLVPYTTPEALCREIKKSSIVITDKLHVGIVGVRFGIPVISVASQSKTLRFYRQIGQEKFCIPLDKIKSGDVYKRLQNPVRDCKKRETIIRMSERHVEYLQTFLETCINK